MLISLAKYSTVRQTHTTTRVFLYFFKKNKINELQTMSLNKETDCLWYVVYIFCAGYGSVLEDKNTFLVLNLLVLLLLLLLLLIISEGSRQGKAHC